PHGATLSHCRGVFVEVADQPGDGLGLACGQMVVEALSMLRRLFPGLEPAQVGEDLAGPGEELSVLGLERGDLVGARHGLEARALLRPRLDLACHEVEAELRE